MPTVTTTVKQTVKLRPALRTQIVMQLTEYGRLAIQEAALRAELTNRKHQLEAAFESAGQADVLDSGVDVDGYRLKIVHSVSTMLNKKFLMEEYGVTAEMLEAATTTKPKKPYLKVTLPGFLGGTSNGEDA